LPATSTLSLHDALPILAQAPPIGVTSWLSWLSLRQTTRCPTWTRRMAGAKPSSSIETSSGPRPVRVGRGAGVGVVCAIRETTVRSEEHTSELQSLAYLV